MLLKINRFGPERQRIQKGYVLSGNRLDALRAAVGDVSKRLPRDGNGFMVGIQNDRRNPRVVWFDTGVVWLHTPGARKACFEGVSRAVGLLAKAVASAGGQLVPNAIRVAGGLGWRPWLCGDRHLLQVVDSSERERFCNLLHQHLPELIAFTGRAAVDQRGVDC